MPGQTENRRGACLSGQGHGRRTADRRPRAALGRQAISRQRPCQLADTLLARGSRLEEEKENIDRTDAYSLPPVDAMLQILGLTRTAGPRRPVWRCRWRCSAVPGSIVSRFAKVAIAGDAWPGNRPTAVLVSARTVNRGSERAGPPVPGHHLGRHRDGDLETVPLESLEQLVAISDQRPAPSGRPVLLLAPNLIKLGRKAGVLDSLPPADWLQKNSTAFRQAIETCRQRSGKTILHENLAVARVGDLALKVAIEKSLGARSCR